MPQSSSAGSFSAAQALENARSNPHSRWCGDRTDEPGVNPAFAANRIRHGFLRTNPKLPSELRASTGIFAIGSCFAREIEAAFARRKLPVLSLDHELMSREIFKGPRQSSAVEYLNRFNTASMLIEVQRLLGSGPLAHSNALIVDRGDAPLDLHFANCLNPSDRNGLIDRREATLSYGEGIRKASVVILTLGVNEVWIDLESNCALNAAPDPRLLAKNTERFALRVLSTEENLQNLEEIFRVVRTANQFCTFVVTVSPVPLLTTFTQDDVISANMHSKATLLVAAKKFCADNPNAFYFPSFEIVFFSEPSSTWKGDARHVTREAADHIMETFAASAGLPSAP